MTPDLTAPDLQFHFAPAFFQEHGFATHAGPALSIGPTLVAPTSRGSVALRSADPGAAPRITTNVFAERGDFDALMVGVDKALEITRTSSFRKLVGDPLRPGPDVSTRAELPDLLATGDHRHPADPSSRSADAGRTGR